jgi:hypothetical protein
MIAAAIVALAAVAAAPPTYVVERVVTRNGASTRLSVFRNGVAVLARKGAGEKPDETPAVVRQPLSEIEVQVLSQVVEECYPDLARFADIGQAPVEGMVELRLAPAGREPLSLRFPLTAAPTLAASRLGQALDGLEVRLTRTNVTREDLRDWEPKIGDRVELEDGRTVEVLDVLISGDTALIRAQVGDGPASIFLNAEELRRLALRRVVK